MPQDLWKTIRRARLVQVLAVYLASAFVVLQATDILVDRLALPDWVFPVAFVLLLIGLPMVTATAVVQSAPQPRAEPDPPGGDDGERRDPGDGSIPGLGMPASDAGAAATAESAVGKPAGLDDAGRSSGARPRWDPDGDGRVTLGDVAMVARQWLTWHRTLVGGVLAFTLLALAVSGYTAMRTLGIGPIGSLVAAGVIDERERILVADFDSPTDSVLAAVVTEAFRIDFGQSPILRVVEPATVRDVLGRMGREPGAGLDHDLAREVALRDGIKALVTGEIAAAGAGYVLSARLVSAGDEQVLAGFRETARDDVDLIPAIDRLSKKLRERIGESLRTIRAAPPLADATTPSLDALRRYTQALHAADLVRDHRRALSLLEEAIALDSAFAMAHRKLAVILRSLGEDRGRQREALSRAHRHLDRLTERERHLTAAAYHEYVSGDSDQVLLAYRALLEMDPEDAWALNNIGVHYARMRDPGRAVEYYRRAIRADTTITQPLSNLIVNLVNDGRFDDGYEVQQEFERRFPGHRIAEQFRIGWAMHRRDFEAAERHIDTVDANWDENPDARLVVAQSRAAVAATLGRLVAAEEHEQRAVEERERRGQAAQLISDAVTTAERRLLVARDTAGGVSLVDRTLERHPLERIDPYDRPYVDLALFWAAVGDAGRVRSLITDFDAELGQDRHPSIRQDRAALDVALALAEHRWRDALRLMPAAELAVCRVCWHPRAGIAFEGAGEPDSAIAAYTAYVETPFVGRPFTDATWLGFVHERLADLHRQRGEYGIAARYADEQLELWRDVDPELRPRIAALQAVLAAAGGEPPPR